MRQFLFASAALLAAGAASAYAQVGTSATPGPSSETVQPPGGSAEIGAPPRTGRRAGRRAAATAAPVDPENPGGGRAPADQYTGVPPTSAYQGGAGSPFSSRATHIDRADTRSVIAPRLPNPDASGNSPQAYMAAAQRALARNQTGAAQEALERAETRILTRSTDPSMANVPDTSGIAQAITDARRALANGDSNRARSIIGQFLNNNPG